MVAARTRLDIATENLANVSTNGFSRVVARGRLGPNGVRIARQRAQKQGPLQHTGRGLDLAIVGRGGFRMRDSAGEVGSTRDGAFVRGADLTLRNAQGETLLGTRGPLHFPDGAQVEEDGRITLAGRTLDRIALPPGSSLHTGFLEGAGVDAIGEMVEVLAAERSFESAQKVVTAIDGTRTSAAESARIK